MRYINMAHHIFKTNGTLTHKDNYKHVYNKKNKGKLERSYQFRGSGFNLLHTKMISN